MVHGKMTPLLDLSLLSRALNGTGWSMFRGGDQHSSYALDALEKGLTLGQTLALQKRTCIKGCYCLVPESWPQPFDVSPWWAGPDAEAGTRMLMAAAMVLTATGTGAIVAEHFLALRQEMANRGSCAFFGEEVYLLGRQANAPTVETILREASSMPVFSFYSLHEAELPEGEMHDADLDRLASAVRIIGCQAYDGDGAIFLQV